MCNVTRPSFVRIKKMPHSTFSQLSPARDAPIPIPVSVTDTDTGVGYSTYTRKTHTNNMTPIGPFMDLTIVVKYVFLKRVPEKRSNNRLICGRIKYQVILSCVLVLLSTQQWWVMKCKYSGNTLLVL